MCGLTVEQNDQLISFSNELELPDFCIHNSTINRENGVDMLYVNSSPYANSCIVKGELVSDTGFVGLQNPNPPLFVSYHLKNQDFNFNIPDNANEVLFRFLFILSISIMASLTTIPESETIPMKAGKVKI